jgi:flagellar basal-body rod protein FlgB
MSPIETQGTNLMERFLDVTVARQALITSNISNIDTPGYRTKDMDFQREMQRVLESSGNHVTPKAQDVQGLMERPDGNNVSMDREGMLLAQTQLQFRMGVQLVKDQLHRVQLAIEDVK